MKKATILFVIFLVVPAGLWAQSLGIHTGIAGVENFEVQQGYSVSLLVKLNDRVLGNLAYHWWGGEDENYRFDVDSPEVSTSSFYFGNAGLNLLLFYRLFQQGGLSIYLGSGLGRYEQIQVDTYNRSYNFSHAAFSHALLLTYAIHDRFSLSFKGTISTEDLFIPPDWGLFNIGVMYHFSDQL